MGVLGGVPFHPMTKCAIYLQKPDTHHLWSVSWKWEVSAGRGLLGMVLYNPVPGRQPRGPPPSGRVSMP